jgi:hypothetical protein
VLAQPALRDWLAEHDADPMTMAQAEFHRFVLSESEAAAALLGTTMSTSSDAPSTPSAVKEGPVSGAVQ